jgi:hypothetical protein
MLLEQDGCTVTRMLLEQDVYTVTRMLLEQDGCTVTRMLLEQDVCTVTRMLLKQSQDGTQFHPDSAWKRPSKACMKFTNAEYTVENS